MQSELFGDFEAARLKSVKFAQHYEEKIVWKKFILKPILFRNPVIFNLQSL